MNERLSIYISSLQPSLKLLIHRNPNRYLYVFKNDVVCIGLQPSNKRQALTSSDPLSAKSFQTLQEKKFDTSGQEHTPPHNTNKMSSIDAVVNAGPSAQQLDDEPVERFDALNIREDSEGWNDVEEDNEEFNVQCLFCSESSTALAKSLDHMKAEHQFDLIAFRTRHGG